LLGAAWYPARKWAALGAIVPFPGRLFEPVEGDPALGWHGVGVGEDAMSTENPCPSRQRDPWNKGRLIGQKRPLKPRDVWTIRVRLQMEGRKRDLAMFNLAIDSKLRGCDLVRLRIDDVSAGGRVRDRATVIQTKTGRPGSIGIESGFFRTFGAGGRYRSMPEFGFW
jgi:hypothetical protein